MEFDEKNPWLVANLNEFLYFCCPECPLKDHSKEEFINHALEFHPKAKNSIETILFEDNDSILPNPDIQISDIQTGYPEDKTISNEFFRENDCNNSDPNLILYKKEASADENEEAENSEFVDYYDEETETS